MKGHDMRIIFLIIIGLAAAVNAACSLDHLLVGCNPDGDPNTTQDNDRLFFDCSQKYRNTPAEWFADYYPLPKSFFGDYRLGEPGVDVITAGARAITGAKNVDYRIMVECVSISDDLRVLNGTAVVLAQTGDEFSHSALYDNHVHLTYYVPNAAAAAKLQWVTLRLYDALGRYQPSMPCTIVFCQPPAPGDIVVDGFVDAADLAEFCKKWLADGADRSSDYHERADINRDGTVNILDFAVFGAFYGLGES